MNAVHYQLVVLFLFDGLRAGLHQNILDPVQRKVQQVVADRPFVLGKLKGIVAVFDGIEHEGHFTDTLKMKTEQSGDSPNQQREAQQQHEKFPGQNAQGNQRGRSQQQYQQSAEFINRAFEHTVTVRIS